VHQLSSDVSLYVIPGIIQRRYVRSEQRNAACSKGN